MTGPDGFDSVTEAELRAVFDDEEYVAEDEIVTTVLLALRMGKPLLVEGEPGAGKTELAKVLAEGFDTDLVRLQCYEGLAAENALYEWNYTKQLLAIQSGEGGVADDDSVFDEEYLLSRPLLEALSGDGDRPPVLLVDEVDRADEEFEALLLEILSDFQVSIPELGTVEAATPPVVILTSNRTRGLSDALKRRCLYLYVNPPSVEKERAIIERKVPELADGLAADVCGVAQQLRDRPLRKRPGLAETLDWAEALTVLGDGGEDAEDEHLSVETARQTLGCLLKDAEDVERIDDEVLESLLAEVHAEP
ncbi:MULTISPECIES: MoxR family ATPase [unclassified Haladaptatus]|uniref:AAA family ATPase n=1 Tax=unclassified Haladaptatus TaxID=2622732 RepID=UPI00209C5A49|nr:MULTISPECIES: MoxR family ATPase [unclassified Haladaptatus]MCO8246934.1 MoxR family ATPase [Haladaptatus sp. AB643]MCO8253540.1 MoxR family ATPase [Haladaptatus sp. AB618]